MRRAIPSPSVVHLVTGAVLTLAIALTWTSVAYAQQSADDQYDSPSAPTGAAAALSCSEIEVSDGTLGAGDTVVLRGAFSASPGASVVLHDADGTKGTLIDGENAEFSDEGGLLAIAVTGDPINVSGGDGQLSNWRCDPGTTAGETGIVASTGISAGNGASGAESGLAGVLPDTGGSMIFVYFAALLISGAGLVLLRRNLRRG